MKDHLCKCLEQYHEKIQLLKQELEVHSSSAELLRKQQRKQKHKHITINPSQMCDICFKPIFDHEFYVFPCQHAFHRMCIVSKLEYYQTHDVEVKVMIDKVKSGGSQIRAIKDHAQQMAQTQNPHSAVSSALIGLVGQELGDKSNTYLNDIKNIFGGPTRAGSVGGIDNSMMSQIRSKDEKAIREKFVSELIFLF